ncbi:MAG TPA: TIGR04283 family arsenosugar biosynthesis glycosyltransferase [Pseudomonadales bacterium]|jgi:rSAM/selenodomain-associated transferase 2|nr:TIGR04283 family arsenosugar biosynthesis glycosyltransferase [Pseudomonadales bacterium]
MQQISIVIPVLNDSAALGLLLDDLDSILGIDAQRIVVDGGSDDGSYEIACERADYALRTAPGRAGQLAAGIAAARGRWIWMLHADTRLDGTVWRALREAIESDGAAWGRFDVRLSGRQAAFRVIETLMNLRSRWSGICTGDQGIFVRRDLLELIDGVPDQPLMEDIELTKRLRRYANPICIDTRLRVSARRWQHRGIISTVLLMWRLRLQYFFGTSPEVLVREYYDGN